MFQENEWMVVGTNSLNCRVISFPESKKKKKNIKLPVYLNLSEILSCFSVIFIYIYISRND